MPQQITEISNMRHAILKLEGPQKAGALFADSLRLRWEVGDKRGIIECLAALVGVAITPCGAFADAGGYSG